MSLPDDNQHDERRKHWLDRRNAPDRRNPARSRHATYDCRSGAPRRESDVAGELIDGDIWWQEEPAPLD